MFLQNWNWKANTFLMIILTLNIKNVVMQKKEKKTPKHQNKNVSVLEPKWRVGIHDAPTL